MRLIDADELLARIRLNYNNHQNISACSMKDIINTTKTAYDVDKVVERLEALKNNVPNADFINGVVASLIEVTRESAE
jgi:hypothetical protein